MAEAKAGTAGAPERVNWLPAGFHSITPYLVVPNAAEEIEFMKTVFGATESMRFNVPKTDRIMHAELRIGDSMVEIGDDNRDVPARPAAMHVYVPDVDAAYKRALAAGATSIHEVMDMEYGERGGGVKDRGGNHWYIATATGARHIPEGLRSVNLYLHSVNAPAMLEFMKNAFAAEEVIVVKTPEGVVAHAKIRVGDSVIELSEAHGPYHPLPCGIHYYVPDCDAVYQRAVRAGAKSEKEPQDQPYGDRIGTVKDLNGNLWFITTHIRDVTF
jgi:PhnB protein